MNDERSLGLASVIRGRAKKLGLTRKQLAEKLGTDVAEIGRLYRDQLDSLSFGLLCRWCRRLGMTVAIRVHPVSQKIKPFRTRLKRI